jgi:SAM-dependent methyltransferase
MIGRLAMPDRFVRWNERWGAPHGRRLSGWRRRLLRGERRTRAIGPFGFQPNNTTRAWEYPWAFHAVPITSGSSVVDVGGALSGFQFALAATSRRVVNVDPFVAYGTAREYQAMEPDACHRSLNAAFGTEVVLRRCDLPSAGLAAGSVDVVYCISTLEHLADAMIEATLAEVSRILAPGGRCVLTVDLFLDLHPFTSRSANRWGRNIDLSWLVHSSGLDLLDGNPSELNGFAEFDPDAVQSALGDYLIGSYPGMAQCLVLARD